MILRWLPLLLFISLLNHALDKLRPLLDLGLIMVAQAETVTIVKTINLDLASGEGPDDDPDAFADYLRQSLNRKTGSQDRDLALDPWGTTYHLSYARDDRFIVISAGPDRVFETNDDIRAGN